MASKRFKNPRGSGGQLREDLIRVASELLERPQLINTPSLRQIALGVGIAPSAVYTQFQSGEQLLQDVIDAQYAILREKIGHAISDSGSALANLEAIATTYVTWGIEHPGIYQLLFESADQLPEGLEANGPGRELLAEIAPLIAQHSGCSSETAHQTTMRLWAALHGLTSLRIHKKHAGWSTKVSEEAVATVRAFLGLIGHQ